MRLIFTDSLIIKKTRSTQLSVAIFTVSVFICTKGVVVVASFAQLTCSLASKRSMRFENICISFDTSIIAFKITQIYSMCVDAKLSQTKVRHSAFTLQHRQTPISVTHFSIWLDSIALEVFSIYRNTLTFFSLSTFEIIFFSHATNKVFLRINWSTHSIRNVLSITRKIHFNRYIFLYFEYYSGPANVFKPITANIVKYLA